MGPLQPRTTSVTITTFTAVVVVFILWILALLAIIMYLLLRRRKLAQRTQRSASFNRSASFDHTAPYIHPNGSTAQTSYPQRAQTPSYPQSGPSPLSETTSLPDLHPVRTVSPAINPVLPNISTRIEDAGRITKVSPTKPSLSATLASNQTKLQVPHAGNPSQPAHFARLQTIPLASDVTDMTAETFDSGRQVVNPGYLAMLAQRGVPARDHALLGSDDSTDAGAGAGIGFSYADRVRGMSSRGASVDMERGRGRYAGLGGGGRARTVGRDNADDGLGRPVVPFLHVRKMASM